MPMHGTTPAVTHPTAEPLPKHSSPPAKNAGTAEQAAAQPQPHRSCRGSARGDPPEGTKLLPPHASALSPAAGAAPRLPNKMIGEGGRCCWRCKR